uniref:Uncharacterized protein n=1 Tax=Arundo donax TaxID=35708 RepID=A0A0A9FD98_ARUDO
MIISFCVNTKRRCSKRPLKSKDMVVEFVRHTTEHIMTPMC